MRTAQEDACAGQEESLARQKGLGIRKRSRKARDLEGTAGHRMY